MRKQRVRTCFFCHIKSDTPSCKFMIVKTHRLAICEECVFTCVDVIASDLKLMDRSVTDGKHVFTYREVVKNANA